MFADLVYRYPRRVLAGTIIVLALGFALIWWNFIWQSPTRVWNGMLRNNLSTTSVTRQLQSGTASAGINQTVRFQMGASNASDWLVAVTQSAGSRVTTESIGTPTTNYVRYLNLQTTQKSSSGKPLDFSSVTNAWGKTTLSKTATNQLFGQSLLDLGTAPMPPIGNLSVKNRGIITRYITKQAVMVPNYKTLKRQVLNGHRVYVYDVTVKLAPYVLVMQAFAKDIGLHDLDSVDATQYLQTKPVTLQFTVDSVSHQLARVSFPTAKYTETYSDYGLLTPIPLPAKTIPLDQLQGRLQNLQ